MLSENAGKFKLILASRSPRRQQLLSEMGLNFEIRLFDFDESYPAGLQGNEIASYLSKQKASYFKNEISENEIIITADTIVWCNGKVLGKPSGREDAAAMLRELSDNTHDVITGVTILTSDGEHTFSDITRVSFRPLKEEEIYYYIDNFNPYDKAGAYGIQEWIGITACSVIEGSYFNVVGLPSEKLYSELEKFIK